MKHKIGTIQIQSTQHRKNIYIDIYIDIYIYIDISTPQQISDSRLSEFLLQLDAKVMTILVEKWIRCQGLHRKQSNVSI